MYNAYNQQLNLDKIDEQINNLQKLKNQIQQPAITQNFQLAPREIIRYAASLDDVQRENVVGDTPFFSKDMSVVWIKNASGEVKTYELNEIVKKDEKDLKIELLQAQIDELKKGVKNESNNTNDVKSSESKKSTNVSNGGKSDEE